MPIITGVDPRSPASRAGFLPGDKLLTVGGAQIRDIFDLKFYSYEADLHATIEREGQPLTLHIRKREGEALGLNFETYLIDKPNSCANSCIFCFIEQMPPNCRETLYFKDDDARLSFLQGNYITMTNLGERDVQRIIDMRISPINISVHTTDPELRCKMLRNRRAGSSLDYLRRFAEAGLQMNGQIVLCPGWNDGPALERTLTDLYTLRPAMSTVSIVPVGLTRYREGLEQLTPVDSKKAREVIALVEEYGDMCIEGTGERMFYCSDEFYLTAGLPLPDPEWYGSFEQLENGVGMATLFEDEFKAALETVPADAEAQPFAIATGELFYPILSRLIDLLCKKCNNIQGTVYAVKNNFFGGGVTVAGLVTGSDLITCFKGKKLPHRLFIPSTMLRSGEDVFLDDLTVGDVEACLGVKLCASEDGAQLVDLILEDTE